MDDNEIKNKDINLKKLENPRPKPDPTKNINESASTEEKLKNIENVVKELEHQEEIARKEANITPKSSAAITKEYPREPSNVTPRSSVSMSNPSYSPPPRRKRKRGGAIAGLGKSAAKSTAKSAAKKGASTAGGWLASLFANPYGLAIIAGIVAAAVAIFFLLYLLSQACVLARQYPFGEELARSLGLNCDLATTEDQIPPPPPGFTIAKIALPPADDGKINNGDSITYEVKVTYDPNEAVDDLDTLILYDNPNFAHENPTDVTDPFAYDGEVIRWRLENYFNPDNSNTQTRTFTFTIKPTVTDSYILNIAYILSGTGGDGTGGGGTGGGGTSSGPGVKACGSRDPGDPWYGADCLPTSRTCSGRWTTQMFRTESSVKNYIRNGRLDGSAGNGYNFGDPLCSFNRSKFERLIDEFVDRGLEANQARGEFWKDIAYCEGTPNSFGTQVSPMGPAGHFQMGIGQPIVFKTWQPDKPNRGDVPWQRQIQNAIKFNNGRKNLSPSQDFTFWGAARCLCWHDGYKDKGYCKAIIDQGLQRSPAACGNAKCVQRGYDGPTL